MLQFGEICGRFFEKTKTGGCIRNLMCYTGRNEKKEDSANGRQRTQKAESYTG